MASAYTPRQGQFLTYIHTYTKLNRQAPSEMEMAIYFQVSPPSVHQMVIALEKRGLIQRTPGQARSIRVLVSPGDLPNLDSGETSPQGETSFETSYPYLTRWVMGDGWVELGRTEWSQSMARVMDEGGMVWEGKERYKNIDELLKDLNAAIDRWYRENQ